MEHSLRLFYVLRNLTCHREPRYLVSFISTTLRLNFEWALVASCRVLDQVTFCAVTLQHIDSSSSSSIISKSSIIVSLITLGDSSSIPRSSMFVPGFESLPQSILLPMV